MTHYRTGTKTIRNRARKRYVLAVVVGVLLGSAYALAGPIHESLKLAPLPTPTPAWPPHAAQQLPSRDSCAAEPVGVLLAMPMYASGRAAEWSAAPTGEAVCTWVI